MNMNSIFNKHLIILITLFSGLFNLYSQIPTVNDNILQVSIKNFGSEATDLDKSINGSPYISEEFSKAHISVIDSIIDMRYNVYKDEMEFKKNSKTYYVPISDSLLIKFISTNEHYIYSSYKLNELTQKGYLLSLTKNKKNNLYLKKNIILVPFKEAINSYDQPKPAHYRKDSDAYLIGLVDGNIVEMPSKKKELLKMFPNKEKEIETFLKSNKTSFKEEKDLILLVNYLDTLN